MLFRTEIWLPNGVCPLWLFLVIADMQGLLVAGWAE